MGGVILAVWLGDYISEHFFKQLMAVIVIVSGIIMIFHEQLKITQKNETLLVAPSLGLLSGFTTMIGNLAGAFTNLYFLAMKFPKKKFIGTAAMLFFMINLFKLPFHIYIWKTIDYDSLNTSLGLVPFVIMGFGVGLIGIKYLNELHFKRYIIFMTILSAILILLR